MEEWPELSEKSNKELYHVYCKQLFIGSLVLLHYHDVLGLMGQYTEIGVEELEI